MKYRNRRYAKGENICKDSRVLEITVLDVKSDEIDSHETVRQASHSKLQHSYKGNGGCSKGGGATINRQHKKLQIEYYLEVHDNACGMHETVHMICMWHMKL